MKESPEIRRRKKTFAYCLSDITAMGMRNDSSGRSGMTSLEWAAGMMAGLGQGDGMKEIRNATSYKWERLRYELTGMNDKGQIVASQWDVEFGWIVQLQDEALVSVQVKKWPSVASWKVRIAGLDSRL